MVLIVIQKNDFTEVEEILLTKILAAIKLQMMEDCLIFKLEPTESVNVRPFIQAKEIKVVLSFGTKWARLGYNLQNRLYDGMAVSKVQFLLSHSLKQLSADPQLKKSLWTTIQKINF